jgi:hypothetical protein
MSKQTNPLDSELPVWLDDEGMPVTCHEKIKVMNENFRELAQVAKDLLEDGVLMGCSESHLRQALHQLLDTVELTY